MGYLGCHVGLILIGAVCMPSDLGVAEGDNSEKKSSIQT